MAHHQSALKRIRIAEKQRQLNRTSKSKLRTLTKAVRTAESKEEAKDALNRVLPVLDKLAGKHLIHANKAANQKSRLTRFVNNIPAK